MKIGIVLSDQCPDVGGGFTFEQGLVDSLRRLKSETPHELVIIGEAKDAPPALAGMPWISLKAARVKKGKIGREIRRIVGKIVPGQEKSAGVYHLDFERSPQIQAANLDLIVYLNPGFSPFLDIPYIINIWDLAHRVLPFFPEISLGGGWEFRERHYRERLQRAAYIITPNATSRQEIIDFYQVPPAKVRPLRHPTPNDVLRRIDAPPQETPLDHLGISGEFLLYPAQFWPHKNHILLLRMLKVLKEKYGFAPQLVLTGADKPLFDESLLGNLVYIKQCASELGLDKQVIYAGFVSREVLIALYQKASALVFASFLGPENLPPLEAFALGCPVIASQLPGSQAQFGEAAIQLDPKSPELWADTVHQLRNAPALRELLIARGKARAREFTSDDFIHGLFQIFDDFAPYRSTWTSALSSAPLKPARRSLHLPTLEKRYARPPLS